jgi:hypothetical protein
MTVISVHRRRIAAAAAVTTAAVLLAGCTTVMDGSAVRDSAFHPGEPTLTLLQTGNYPTAPTAAPPPNAGAAAIMEAQRMAEYVVYPWDVDPRLTEPDRLGLAVIKNPKALGYAILDVDSNADDPVQTIASSNGFISGFATTRGTPANAPGKHMGLYLIVMRFPDPDKATAAAAEFNAHIPPPTGASAVRPIPIPGHPEAQATTYVMDNGHIGVTSNVAHGVFVFHVFAQTDDTADAAAATIAKTLDLQGPRIDQFQPTDPAQFASTNLDPTGMKVRTLQRQTPQATDGVYTTAAELHLAAGDNPQVAIDRFNTFGIDLISDGKAVVYRAKDADAANGFASTVAKDFAENATPKPAVPGFPGARCFTLNTAKEYEDTIQCVGTADRYVITVFSKQNNDAIQQISAQYLMLTAK